MIDAPSFLTGARFVPAFTPKFEDGDVSVSLIDNPPGIQGGREIVCLALLPSNERQSAILRTSATT